MTMVKNQSLAEEITQNTFFKAMTAKKKFEGKSKELTWLCGIAKNLAIDECRRNAKTGELDEVASAASVDIEAEAEDKDCLLYTSCTSAHRMIWMGHRFKVEVWRII